MKKTSPIILALIIFIFLSIYLHQKVQIYTTAFCLQDNYNHYQELAAEKDYLVHNFTKKVSLSSVNKWVLVQNFSSPEKEKLLAFRPYEQNEVNNNPSRSFFENIRSSTPVADVFAKE